MSVAAQIARPYPATFHCRMKDCLNPTLSDLHHRRALNDEDEEMICKVVLQYLNVGKQFA